MNKMKVIELLNKIANGEEIPNKIKYDNMTFHMDEYEKYYVSDEGALFEYIFVSLNDYDALMTEVEIIEEPQEHKIPEKLETMEKFNMYEDSINWYCNDRAITDTEKDIMDKINEIIDYLKENR